MACFTSCTHDNSIRDVLYFLALSYMLMNPIRGIIPGSPYCSVIRGGNYDLDDIDNKLEQSANESQKTALRYIKEKIKTESRYKMKKFIDN